MLLGCAFAADLLIAMVAEVCAFVASLLAAACFGCSGDQGQVSFVLVAAFNDFAVEDHAITAGTDRIACVAVLGADGLRGIFDSGAAVVLALLYDRCKDQNTAALAL